MSRVVRIGRYLLYSTLSAVIFILLFLSLILGTEPGSRSVLWATNTYFSSVITADSIDGVLLRDFELRNINLKTQGNHIEIGSLSVRWRPWQLLKKEIHIRELEAHGLRVKTVTTSEPSPAETIELPNISSPLRVRLDRFYLVSNSLEMGTRTYDLKEAVGRLRFDEDVLTINHLFADNDSGSLRISGQVQVSDAYPISVDSHIQVAEWPDFFEPSENPVLTGDIELEGTLLDELRANINTQGAVALQANGSFENALSPEITWQFDVESYLKNMSAVSSHTDAINVHFSGQGGHDFAQGNLLISSTFFDYGLVTVEASGEFREQSASLQSFMVQASEYGAAFELTGSGEVSAESITANMRGVLEYQDLPAIDIEMDWAGSAHHVDQANIVATSEHGTLTVVGAADWRDPIQWNATLTSEQLHLEKPIAGLKDYLDRLPQEWGESIVINGELSTEGRWNKNSSSLEATLVSQDLFIEAGQRNISTQLSINMTDQVVNIVRASARAASSRVDVSGTLEREQVDIEAAVYSPDLNQLHESLAGRLQLETTIQGSLPTPEITIDAQGDYLSWQEYSIATLKSDLQLNLDFSQLPKGELSLLGVRGLQQYILPNEANELPFDILISAKQNNEYQLNARIHNELMEISGGFSGEGGVREFNGQTSELLIRLPDFGIWHASPTQFEWTANESQPQQFSSEYFCLVRNTREASVCGDVLWNEARQEVHLDARNVSLYVLAPWLPENMRTDGFFSVFGEFSRTHGSSNYRLNVETSDISISMPEQDIELWFNAGQLIQIEGTEEQLNGSYAVRASDVEGRITGQITITDPFGTQQLESRTEVAFEELQIVSLLVPQLQNVNGRLFGDFAVGGSLKQPVVQGALSLENGSAEIPEVGISVQALNARVLSPQNDESPFTLEAHAESDGGHLDITGEYSLQNQTASVRMEGENFEAMETRDLHLFVSPNLQFDYTPAAVHLTGILHIPRAQVSPPNFETVQRSSPDTVVLRNDDRVWENQSSLPYNVDVQVTLGERVNVSAYGFEGRINGGLRVIEQPNQETSAIGNINVVTGQYELYGQQLNVDRGTLVYSGGALSNPGLDLRVSRQFESEQTTVGARVGGSLRAPRLNLFSTPQMQDAEILSYLVLGRGFSEENSEDQNLFLQASLALGLQGGNILGERLSNTLGVDEIVLDGGNTIESTALYIGKQISPRLYVRYGVGLVEPVSTFFIRYRISDYLSFETQTGTLGSGADLFYTIEK